MERVLTIKYGHMKEGGSMVVRHIHFTRKQYKKARWRKAMEREIRRTEKQFPDYRIDYIFG